MRSALYAAWCIYAAWFAVFAATTAGRELRVLQADARAAFYLGIAAPPSASAVVRAFNRSLAEVAQTHLAADYPLYLRNISLLPLYIELPEDESLPNGELLTPPMYGRKASPAAAYQI